MALSTTGPGDTVQGKADVSSAAWRAGRQGQDSRDRTAGSTSGTLHSTCVPHELELGRELHPCGAPTSSSNSPLALFPLRRSVPSLLLSATANQRPTAALLLNQNSVFFQLRLLPWMAWGVHLCWLQQKEKELLLFKTYSSFPSRLLSAVTWRVFSPFSRDIQLRKQVSPQMDKQAARKRAAQLLQNGGRTLLNAASQANPGTIFFQSMAQVGMATWTFSALSHTHGWVWGRK